LKSFAAERLQILKKARQIAKENIEDKQKKYKFQHEKKSKPYDFSIGQQFLYAQTDFIGKNKKLAPKYIRPATIIEVNDTLAKLEMPNNKIKSLNVNKLKHFFPGDHTELNGEQDADAKTSEDLDLIKFNPSDAMPTNTC